MLDLQMRYLAASARWRADKTETTRAVEELRLREERLAVTLQSIGDGAIATDEAAR